MVTKRRKQSPKKRGESKKQRTEKATSDVSEVDNKDGNTGMTVPELYRICIVDGSPSERSGNIRSWEEKGALPEVVWPFLVANSDNTDSDEFKNACRLLVVFVSQQTWRGSFGSSTLDSLESEATIKNVFETLLYKTNEKDDNLQAKIVHFLIVVLSSDNSQLRKVAMEHLSGIKIWHWMPERRRELELKKSAGLRRKFADAEKKDVWIVLNIQRTLGLLEGLRADLENDEENEDNERGPTLMGNSKESKDSWAFLFRSLELMIDLLSVTSTRLCLVTYLDAIHFSVRCHLSLDKCNDLPENSRQLLEHLLRMIDQLLAFPVQDVNHRHMSKIDVTSMYHARASVFQKMAHRHYPQKLQHVIHTGVGLLCGRQNKNSYMERLLAGFGDEDLHQLLFRMRLVDDDSNRPERNFMLKVLEHHLTIPEYPMEQLRSLPLYPTESILWDGNIIPPSNSKLRSNPVLALPKINRQFLSYQDYLMRNFDLVRLESAYEIRSDLVDVIKRVRPVLRQAEYDDSQVVQFKTEFNGWSRMALELAKGLSLVEVLPPKLGETSSSQVTAEVTIDLEACGATIREEWDSIGEFDNLFLVAIDASKMTGAPAPLVAELSAVGSVQQQQKATENERRIPDDEDSTFADRFGVTLVRGCMVLHVRDEEGNILSDPSAENKGKTKQQSTKRILRVALDPVQYAKDSQSLSGTDMYQSCNLVVRRHGRENNFKSVLETIRDLNFGAGAIGRVIPPWLQSLLLGYADPNSASYKSKTVKEYALKTVGVNNPTDFLDFGDTFIDESHLRESFEGDVVVDGQSEINKESRAIIARHNYKVRMSESSEGSSGLMEAKSYSFPANVKGNPVRFTPLQVEAIRSGLSPGLTCIVGPPGTGKTDVAVQIIASLYHSFPTQRTVIITHSNAALNDIFQKVMARGDVDERYLVRLGSGEKSLETDSNYDFTKIGRVAFSLERRSALLEEVQLMSESFGITGKGERGADGSSAYTCGTADYFYKHHIQKRRKIFERRLKVVEDLSKPGELDVSSFFPFTSYFHQENQKISLKEAQGYIGRIEKVFSELKEYRPFELLRSQRQRADYLILKQARIVAMTCTHAAIVRSRLIELGFEYDNVVMEEAGQMLEVESFIPLLLQRGESDNSVSGLSRLKRICLMGDHNQLPPVVKNSSFSRFSNLDQSQFARLIRLGVPYIQFDKQGRARPELARLYSWRYNGLGDLSHVTESEKFQLANPGFANTFQIINVDAFEGKGETTPTAYFYQNIGEAEYVVALFQYMVLIGYSPSKISIITTYNGQKSLISDVLNQRCGRGTPFQGVSPGAISTVDQYQGQQNDIILLSLVRTEAVGHLRDIRRLVVAVSRARLGLYVFCRATLFGQCHELKRTLSQFDDKPKKLQLVLGEQNPTTRKVSDDVPSDKIFDVENVSHLGSIVHSMQENWIKAQHE